MSKSELDLDQLKQCYEWIEGKYYLPAHLARELVKEVEKLQNAHEVFLGMSTFEKLKDKIAYFGGYKWLPYVEAEKLLEDIEIKNKHLEMLRKSNREYQALLEHYEKALKFYADEEYGAERKLISRGEIYK
jgi:hypothetical protein